MVKKISTKNMYRGKNILLTGVTGFMGRMFLSLILYHLNNIHKVYLLVRTHDHHKSLHRVIEMLKHSEVFDPVIDVYKEKYLQFIDEKVVVVEGDLTRPKFALEPDCYDHLANQIDLIIHNASLTTFAAPIDVHLETNINGTRELIELVKIHKRAKILYVSSCYAVGNRSGLIKEEQVSNQSPNGKFFDVNAVIKEIQKQISQIKSKYHQSHKDYKKKLIQIGNEFSDRFGWSNSYVFTKGLAEALLFSERTFIDYAIVRPSVVESSISYPFVGWNHGFNASAPFIFMGDFLYPPYIIKKDMCLDIVPVDIACSSILFVGAMLIDGQHETIYHIASSNLNKMELGKIVNIIVNYKSNKFKINNESAFYQFIYPLIKRKIITPNHFLSPMRLHNFFIGSLDRLLFFENLQGVGSFFKIVTKPIKHLEKKFNKLAKLYRSFLPYTYYNDCIFETKNIKKIISEEEEFLFDVENIEWENYWRNIHIPGVEKWCHPPQKMIDQRFPH